MPTISKVLCIEDDPDIRLILDLSLRVIGGYEVRLCEGGEAGLETLKTFRPNIILLDVMMPGLSGPETLAQIQTQDDLRDIPVVFMTAKAMIEELRPLLDIGATGVIVKPFDPMTLPSDLLMYCHQGVNSDAS